MSAEQLQDLYNQPAAGPADTRRVTMDDVIMKTLSLFAIVLVFGAIGWVVAANSQTGGFALWMGGMIGTLVLGLVIAFKRRSASRCPALRRRRGALPRAVSQFFIMSYPGVGRPGGHRHVATFTGMFLAYRFGLIRVTAGSAGS